MFRLIFVLGFIFSVFSLVIGDEKEKTHQTGWHFNPIELVQKICEKNQWQFHSEYKTTISQKYCSHYRFFWVSKPIDGFTASLLVLVISSDQKNYILHQTITFDQIESKENLYPKDKEEAIEIAFLKEQLSKDYLLWSPYYVMESKVAREDKDNLCWEITFTYRRITLRAISGPTYDKNTKPPLKLVPQESYPLPQERYLTRTVKLTHHLKLEIVRLIELLGNDEWHIRDKATQDLIAIGKPCIPLLKEALKHPDPEIRMRSDYILKKIN